MKYNIDNEGLECEIELDGFDTVTFLFSDAEEFNEDIKHWIDDIKGTLPKIYDIIVQEIDKYLIRIYSTSAAFYRLYHVYVYPDDDFGTFGLMFRLDIDTEHGLGVKLEKFQVKEVGTACVAFS